MSIAAGQRWTHVKRGTTYEVIGIGELQMSADLVDGSSLVIYRGDDGKLWAREEGEFLDGRFEPVSDRYRFDPRMTPTNDAPVTVEQCPFCGGEARVCPDTGYDSATVFCPDSNDCPVNPSADADLAIGETLADAIRRWNTRHRLAALASAPAVDESRAVALVRRIAAREPWQAHYGRTWEDEAADIVAGLTASAPAGDGVADQEVQALADRLTKNQRAVIEGRQYTDIDSERARTRARSDVWSMGLGWPEGDGLTPLGKRVAAALARPRAAVGEQSREAIARAAADGCDDQYPEGRRVQNGEKWWAAYDGAMRALALQSPLAKVEG